MIRLFFRQFLKHEIHGIFEFLVIFPDLGRVDELDQRGKVLFLHRGLIMDITDERRVEQRLCLLPEIVSFLALALGVGDQRRD
ncbi:hypothetical protein SDC9_181110 [bioreactor metagenome]|uniref:Uncharacterized protein n=1 Tax=bioreactor metagenome TaxID=1076179 RepID=A0A645H3L0_9ZZZZ